MIWSFRSCSQLYDHKTPYKKPFVCGSVSVNACGNSRVGRHFANCLASPDSGTETFLGGSPATNSLKFPFVHVQKKPTEGVRSIPVLWDERAEAFPTTICGD